MQLLKCMKRNGDSLIIRILSVISERIDEGPYRASVLSDSRVYVFCTRSESLASGAFFCGTAARGCPRTSESDVPKRFLLLITD